MSDAGARVMIEGAIDKISRAHRASEHFTTGERADWNYVIGILNRTLETHAKRELPLSYWAQKAIAEELRDVMGH